MENVALPCYYEEWPEYLKIFLILSRMWSLQDLKLLISSHTRAEDTSQSPTTSKCLRALKGLLAFLEEFCTPEEQKKFVSKTLPSIARAASLLEERVPYSGIPHLQKQESTLLLMY